MSLLPTSLVLQLQSDLSAMEAQALLRLSLSPTHPSHNPLHKTALTPLHSIPNNHHHNHNHHIYHIIRTARRPTICNCTLTSSTSTRPTLSPHSLQYPSGFLGAVPDRSSASGSDIATDHNSVVNALGYLTNMLSSKVYDVAIESPLHFAPKLSERLGVNLWLKREDLQPVCLCSVMLCYYHLCQCCCNFSGDVM